MKKEIYIKLIILNINIRTESISQQYTYIKEKKILTCYDPRLTHTHTHVQTYIQRQKITCLYNGFSNKSVPAFNCCFERCANYNDR